MNGFQKMSLFFQCFQESILPEGNVKNGDFLKNMYRLTSQAIPDALQLQKSKKKGTRKERRQR